VVDALTGSPVAGASVAVDGSDPIPTDSDGQFRIERPASASVRLVVEASGYWPRETGMRPSSANLPAVTFSLLPDGNDFDLEFYDHVFRKVGEAGTHPWVTEPEFEIWDGTYDCTGFVEGRACEELTALEERAPSLFSNTMRGVIGADSSKYTDGHVLGSRVTTRSHEPGAVLSRSQYIEAGKVTAAFVNRDDSFSWAFWRFRDDGPMVGAHLQINSKHRGMRGVYSHELAHSLGFDHPLGLEAVPLNSIMRRGHGDDPTRFDVLHGRILYGRPANSRSPDIDPVGFTLNGLRVEGAGVEITRSAP
jgi:hypothetical protein